MDTISLSPQELEQELKHVRRDWTPIYLKLNEVGNVVFPKMPKGLQNAIYSHYRTSRLKAKMKTLEDGRVLVYLEPR